MEYAEAISSLNEMKSRFKDGFSSTDRALLDTLHRILFGKGITNKSCGDCYRDAYIIICNKLKKLKTMPKAKSQYTLKAGAILRRAGDNKFYANPLPNDEIPEKYLADFPYAINLFAAYPADWEARVARRKEGKLPEGELSQDDAQNIIKGLEADCSAKDEEIGNLNLQIQALAADLQCANGEIAELKAGKAKLEEELATFQEKQTKAKKAKE